MSIFYCFLPLDLSKFYILKLQSHHSATLEYFNNNCQILLFPEPCTNGETWFRILPPFPHPQRASPHPKQCGQTIEARSGESPTTGKNTTRHAKNFITFTLVRHLATYSKLQDWVPIQLVSGPFFSSEESAGSLSLLLPS